MTSRRLRVTNRRPCAAAVLTSGFESTHSAVMSERLKVPALPLFVIATAFGVSSTFQAYSMSVLEDGTAVAARRSPSLLALNLVYWYLPALLAPTIMAVALRYQLGRVRWSTQALVHVTGALVYSVVHTVAMLATRAVLFPERPAGHAVGAVDVGAARLPDAARLAVDDLSVPGRSRARAGLPARVGSARARRRPSRNASGGGAAAGAAAPAAPALPVQHAEHDFRADAHQRRTPPT